MRQITVVVLRYGFIALVSRVFAIIILVQSVHKISVRLQMSQEVLVIQHDGQVLVGHAVIAAKTTYFTVSTTVRCVRQYRLVFCLQKTKQKIYEIFAYETRIEIHGDTNQSKKNYQQTKQISDQNN